MADPPLSRQPLAESEQQAPPCWDEGADGTSEVCARRLQHVSECLMRLLIVAHDGLGIVGALGLLDLHQDAVAGGIRQQLERPLLAVQPLPLWCAFVTS